MVDVAYRFKIYYSGIWYLILTLELVYNQGSQQNPEQQKAQEEAKRLFSFLNY